MIPNESPEFSHLEPILSVRNITETIRHWRDVLGFTDQWAVGDPPFHGGVSWEKIRVMFSQMEDTTRQPSTNVLWIRTKYIDSLYKFHQQSKATIVEALERKPWGMDEYAVRDINGHYIAFSGHSAERKKSSSLPPEVSIIDRIPTNAEMLALAESVGWQGRMKNETMDSRLAAVLFGVVAVDTSTGETIGCALLLGDNASFYYLKDVMVKASWQNRKVGSAMMQAINNWLAKNGVPNSLVGLYTGENLEPFYQKFGFDKVFGMIKYVPE